MKIYVKELKCYQSMPEEIREKARISGETCFLIPEELAEGIKDQMERYIRFRGETLSLDSMRGELWRLHALTTFLMDRHRELSSLCDMPLDALNRSLRVWMVKNGYQLSGIHHRLNADTVETKTSPLILYLEKLYAFAEEKEDIPEMEKDIWDLSKLGFPVRNNPVHRRDTLKFTSISQDGIRKESKKAVATTIRYLAIHTLDQQLRAMKRLSAFLAKYYPGIVSTGQLNRDIIEDYLTHISTEVSDKKSFRSELTSLKSLMDTIALVTDAPQVRQLFLSSDATDRGKITGFKAYSDEEVKMWNEAILTLPKQIARALIIHQLLGNRIGETLTLKKDCICKRGGHMKVKVFQIKTQTTVYKPAEGKVIALIEKAAKETALTYGEREYIFVNSRNPDLPMTYATVQYHLMKMIRQLDLRNENGELYGVGTHAFRHTMGRKLTQMHYDDKTIAQLLGHSGLESVHKYRKFGSKELSDETRKMRDHQDGIIERITKEWG